VEDTSADRWHATNHKFMNAYFRGMDATEIIAIGTLAIGLVSGFVKHTNDLTRMRERIKQLEQREKTIESKLDGMLQSINRIEMALVQGGLIKVD